MRFVYSWLMRCAAPFAFAQVLWRGLRDCSYWQGLAERFGLGKTLPSPGIWLHAVSLGEMSAAAPLVRALHSRYPQLPLVVTAATPAGRARAQALFAAADIRFLPYDTPGSVRRFLARIRPRVAIIMETELWPNLFHECARRGVPVFLASARLSTRSVSRYRRLGTLFSGIFTRNVVVAAQSASDAERFRSIGADANQTRVVGSVKFDLQLDEGLIELGKILRAAYGGARPVWVAGSTHAGEEEQVLDAHALLQVNRPDSLLLLVPRHRDRFADVAELLTRRGIQFARRSAMARGERAPRLPSDTPVLPNEMPVLPSETAVLPSETAVLPNETAVLPNETAVLLVDTLGELATLYASADVAFVGGSLVPIGGHNLLEPAALGLPVLTGPSYFNSKEIALLLLHHGAALQVAGAKDLAATLLRLLDEPAERRRIGLIGKGIVESNRGSVERLLALIEPSLPGALQPGLAVQAYPSAGH
jgi:3-deoxy-D-manno-octulosonic-acid transferase